MGSTAMDEHPVRVWFARRRTRISRALDAFFFIFAGIATFWLAFALMTDSLDTGWWGVLVALVFWALLAYLALPRLHRVLTTIYVPDYFIGRTRTSDGLLGDPVNLALMGHEERLHAAMTAAGWTQADDLGVRSSMRIVTSTLTRSSYPEAPVSPLFLFGRQQDFAYQQEVAGNPAKRHHARFWRCPDDWLLPGGHHVDWLAAGTFDRAVGLSLFTLQVTHKIDENTDIERDHIVATVLAAGVDAQVRLLKDFSTGYHSRNGGGDSIRTDGDLPIIDLSESNRGLFEPHDLVKASDAGDWRLHEPSRSAEQDAVRAPHTASDAAMGAEVSKRPAFEMLIEDGGEASSVEEVRRHGRPTTTTFGAGVVLLRALLAGLITLRAVTLPRDEVVRFVSELGIDPSTSLDGLGVYWTFVIGGAIATVVMLLLALLILRGVNLARLIVLIYATVTTLFTFITHAAGMPLISDFSTLVAVTLNILILMALSGRPARAYAQSKWPR